VAAVRRQAIRSPYHLEGDGQGAPRGGTRPTNDRTAGLWRRGGEPTTAGRARPRLPSAATGDAADNTRNGGIRPLDGASRPTIRRGRLTGRFALPTTASGTLALPFGGDGRAGLGVEASACAVCELWRTRRRDGGAKARHPPLHPLRGGESGWISVIDNFAGRSEVNGVEWGWFFENWIERRTV